jgi:hypothetical protein
MKNEKGFLRGIVRIIYLPPPILELDSICSSSSLEFSNEFELDAIGSLMRARVLLTISSPELFLNLVYGNARKSPLSPA